MWAGDNTTQQERHTKDTQAERRKQDEEEKGLEYSSLRKGEVRRDGRWTDSGRCLVLRRKGCGHLAVESKTRQAE